MAATAAVDHGALSFNELISEDTGGSSRPPLLRTASNRHQFTPAHELPRTAMSVVDALVTPHFAQGSEDLSRQGPQRVGGTSYSGYVRKRQRAWPHSWQSRWVTVRLEGFARCSEVSIRSDAQQPFTSSTGQNRLKVFRNKKGFVTPSSHEENRSIAAVTCGLAQDGVRGSAVFTINATDSAGGIGSVVLKTIPGTTPAALVAALASLAWPPNFTVPATSRSVALDYTDVLCASGLVAHSLLVDLGDMRAVEIAMLHQFYGLLWTEEALSLERGIVELSVWEGENSGDYSANSLIRGFPPNTVVIPAGIARGSVFHVPEPEGGLETLLGLDRARLRAGLVEAGVTGVESSPSPLEVASETGRLLEQAEEHRLITHEQFLSMTDNLRRERIYYAGYYRQMFARRLDVIQLEESTMTTTTTTTTTTTAAAAAAAAAAEEEEETDQDHEEHPAGLHSMLQSIFSVFVRPAEATVRTTETSPSSISEWTSAAGGVSGGSGGDALPSTRDSARIVASVRRLADVATTPSEIEQKESDCWVCSTCTFDENPDEVSRCSLCEALRPGSGGGGCGGSSAGADVSFGSLPPAPVLTQDAPNAFVREIQPDGTLLWTAVDDLSVDSSESHNGAAAASPSSVPAILCEKVVAFGGEETMSLVDVVGNFAAAGQNAKRVWDSTAPLGNIKSAKLSFFWNCQSSGPQEGRLFARRGASVSGEPPLPWWPLLQHKKTPRQRERATIAIMASELRNLPQGSGRRPLEFGYTVGDTPCCRLIVTGCKLQLKGDRYTEEALAGLLDAQPRVRVTLPLSAQAGQVLDVPLPTGGTHQVQVPSGVARGAVLEVDLSPSTTASAGRIGTLALPTYREVKVSIYDDRVPGSEFEFTVAFAQGPVRSRIVKATATVAIPPGFPEVFPESQIGGRVRSVIVRVPRLLGDAATDNAQAPFDTRNGIQTGEPARVSSALAPRTRDPNAIALRCRSSGCTRHPMDWSDGAGLCSGLFTCSRCRIRYPQGGYRWLCRSCLESLCGNCEFPVSGAPAPNTELVISENSGIGGANSSGASRRNSLEARLCPLRVEWGQGHEEFTVSRASFLVSALEVLPRDPRGWHKTWRFQFKGEPAQDAGGVAREFWQLISEQLFHPHAGLFMYSATDNLTYQINPLAASLHGDETAARMFRVTGRLLGKALLDRQLLTVSLNRPLLKHVLALPVTFSDLEQVDASLHRNLKWILECRAGEVEGLCQTFTVTEEHLGQVREVPLVAGGGDLEVSDENKVAFVQARFKHAMMDRIAASLGELLNGFYEVVPLSVLHGSNSKGERLDAQELEVLLCGIPEINVADWKSHTTYTNGVDKSSRRVTLFWKVVEEVLDQDQRTRLLQFVTGTSRLPAGGFANLQGVDGSTRIFEIFGIEGGHKQVPRSHTCFNRLDLPDFTTFEHMRLVLTSIVACDPGGFSIN